MDGYIWMDGSVLFPEHTAVYIELRFCFMALCYMSDSFFLVYLFVLSFRWMFLASVPIRTGTGTTTGRRTRTAGRLRRRASMTQTTSTTSHSYWLRKAKSDCLKVLSGSRHMSSDLHTELHSGHGFSNVIYGWNRKWDRKWPLVTGFLQWSELKEIKLSRVDAVTYLFHGTSCSHWLLDFPSLKALDRSFNTS